jgi:DNA-binding ferritin-like protein
MSVAYASNTNESPFQGDPEMFKTKNDLSDAVRVKAMELLYARLADCIDLQTQTQQAHGNVKGPNFIALHERFDLWFVEAHAQVAS